MKIATLPLDRDDPPAVVPRNRGGRPRKEPTIEISIRIETAVYDQYCRASVLTARPARALMRQVLRDGVPRLVAPLVPRPPARRIGRSGYLGR